MNFKYFTFLLLFWGTIFGQSGRINSIVFEEREGLELDRIMTMAYDDEGFIWLGGTNLDVRTIVLSDKRLVLQRFNGRTFHNIPLPKRDEAIVLVNQIYKRADGKLYVLAEAKKPLLYLFDPIELSFEEISSPDPTPPWDGISGIFHHLGKEFVLTQKGRVVTLQQLKLNLELVPVFSFTNEENKFLVDRATVFLPFKDFCMIGDDNFPITFFNWDGEVIKRFSGESFERDRVANLDKFWINELFTHKGEYLALMFNKDRIHKIDTIAKTILPIEHSPNEIGLSSRKAFVDTKGGNIIVSVDSIGQMKLHKFENDALNLYGDLTILDRDTGIQLLSKDLNEGLWIGTTDKKLIYLKFPGNKVRSTLQTESIRSLYPWNEEEIMITTEGNGWYLMNMNTFNTEPYTLLENNIALKPSSSRNIIAEGANDVWSNHSGNILKVNKTSGTAEAYRHYPVLCLERLNDSTLVYGTGGYNLMAFNTQTKTHTPIAKTDSLNIYDLLVLDELNLILGATDKGLLHYDTLSKQSRIIQAAENFNDSFLLSAEYHPDHGYLFGSRSGEIVRYYPETDSFELKYKDELNAGIATILFDSGTWWINTFKGIVSFDPNTANTVRFAEKDGFSHKEANRYSALQFKDQYFVGTLEGLNAFKPSELKPAVTDSRLVLLKVRSYDSNAEVVIDRLNRTQFSSETKIVLPAEYKELQLDFALTHNTVDSEYRYSYRLNNSEWVDLYQQQSIRFPNLAPGTYELEIKAVDFSGNSISQPLVLAIVSQNFFYKTWWFYLLATIFTIALFSYLLRQAGFKQKMQQQFSEDLLLSQETERTRIAKELHDSVGQQLTLIKKKAQTEENSEISNMTNNALEEVRSISRGLYPAVLVQLGLSESIEQLIFELDEQTSIFFSSEIDDIDAFFNEKESLNLYRFIQESVNNILKHSEASTVKIKVADNKEQIRVQITDNGKGFEISEKQKQNSLGLKTLAERIRILGGALEIKTASGKGTSIIAEIPKKK